MISGSYIDFAVSWMLKSAEVWFFFTRRNLKDHERVSKRFPGLFTFHSTNWIVISRFLTLCLILIREITRVSSCARY